MEHMDEFYTAYPLIKQLYGVELTPEDFEEIQRGDTYLKSE